MSSKPLLGIFYSKAVWWVLGFVILGLAIGLGIYYWPGKTQNSSESSSIPSESSVDWQKITGCIVVNGQEVNFEFSGKKEWVLVTENMGCGKSYEGAQSWGLKDKVVSGEKMNIALISAIAYSSKPDDSSDSNFAYFEVPDQDGWYLALQRISATIQGTNYALSDSEWQRVKDSFKFL